MLLHNVWYAAHMGAICAAPYYELIMHGGSQRYLQENCLDLYSSIPGQLQPM